jgi:hypothetical protein
MQTFDLTLRDLLMDGAPALLGQAAGIAGIRLAPLEVPVVGGGRLDLFGEIDGESALHIEVQADNDPAMPVRMLGYLWLSLRQRPALKVRQMVLYVGRDGMAMADRLDGPGLAFRFQLVDARDLSSDALLASDHPCDIIMALFAATDDIKARVRAVVRRLASRFADDPPRLRDALVRLTLLAPLRRAEPLVHEEISFMPITIDLETHPFASKFFLKGRAEGRAEAKAEMLLRLLRRRFPALPDDVEARVLAADGDQLDLWSERILDASDVESVFH